MLKTSRTRVPLSRLQIIDECPSPLKCSIRFSNRKFPSDFFASASVTRESSPLGRANPMAPSFVYGMGSKPGTPLTIPMRQEVNSHARPRFIQPLEIKSAPFLQERRDSMTARELQNGQNHASDLILGVISTSREIKRMLRKHSIDLKKSTEREDELELPPLIMKRTLVSAL